MKKYIAALLAASLIYVPSLSSAETIYQNVESEILTRGVTYEKINTFSEDGWVRANVVKVDLTDPNPSVRVLVSAEGSGRLSTVMTMAEAAGVKAAVNGDFFNFSSGETNMLGMVYQDGELISTPSSDGLSSFVLTEDNRVIFDYFTFSGKLIAENTSYTEYSSCELYQINKIPLTTGAITMITSAWGKTVTVPEYCYAMVTEPADSENSYRAISCSWGGEAVSIPEGGAVFISKYDINGFLNENFAMGDVIRVEASVSPDVGKIKESTGGNTVIVKDGQIASFTNNITGNNQRTAIGLSESDQTLFLVTVDGRESDCPGMTQTQLANFMISLGCDYAMNLDGGGSTTMVAENRFTGALEVKNSVSSLRKVSTGIGVASVAESSGIVSGAEIRLSADTILLGDSAEVYAAFYDENHNNLYYDISDVTYTCSDPAAIINGNSIMPTSPGKHTVSVSFEGITEETEINVISDIFSIKIYPEVISTAASDQTLVVTAYDRNGSCAYIPSRLVTFTPSESVAMAQNTVKKGSGKGTVTASYNSLTSVAAVNGETYERTPDIKAADAFEGVLPSAQSVTVAGGLSPVNLLGKCLVNRALFHISGDDVYALSSISDASGILSFYRAVNGFTERTIENTKIVTFSNAVSSSFRLTDSAAWAKFKTVCASLSQQNLIVMINDPLYQTDSGEREVFCSFVESLANNGKNVFVVSTGEKSETTVSNGVRYITVGNIGASSVASYDYDTQTNKFLKFYFSGDDIRYCFE